MLGAIFRTDDTADREEKLFRKNLHFSMTIEISIETILYVGTTIMLTLSLAVVLTVYFIHRNYLKQTEKNSIIIRQKLLTN